MAEVILRPGTVAFIAGVSGVTGGVTGSAATVWRDGSDATYVTLHAERRSSGPDFDEAQAYLDALPGTIPAASYTDVTATVRGVYTGPAGTAGYKALRVQVQGAPSLFGQDFGVADWTWPDDGALHELTVGIDPDLWAFHGWTLEDFATYMASPQVLSVAPFPPTGAPVDQVMTFTAYEVWLTFTYPGAEITPPLRQAKRGDGLGLSGTRRATKHKSQQSSARRAGGFI